MIYLVIKAALAIKTRRKGIQAMHCLAASTTTIWKSKPFTIQEFHHGGFSHPHSRRYHLLVVTFIGSYWTAECDANGRGLLPQKNGTIEIQNYECRLRKSKQSGKAPTPKNGVRKRYGTTVRQSGLCYVRSKTTLTMNQPIVITIDRSATTNIYIRLLEFEKRHPRHCRSNWLRSKLQRVMHRHRVWMRWEVWELQIVLHAANDRDPSP